MKISRSRFFTYLPAVSLLLAMGCSSKPAAEQTTEAEKTPEAPTSVVVSSFGKLSDGKAVTLYTLTNKNGVEMKVIDYGGIIVSLKVPDKNKVVEDVVLGFDSLSDYEKHNPFFGALVGRYGNRIAKGKFTLDGKTYKLATNNGENHLHGGKVGFDKAIWATEVISKADNPALKLTHKSADGDEGYPGNLNVEVIYTLTEENEVKIEYKADTDKKTVINLTNHSYFNLTGNAKRDILDHQVVLEADHYLPVDKGLIPTGEIKSVDKTPFDFRKAVAVGARIDDNDAQLKAGMGYDHCWVFTDKNSSMKNGGSVYEPVSGRLMEFATTEPAVQFYTGNHLTGDLKGKFGVVYSKRMALCLETEHYPDSPNQKAFPSVELEPGKTYKTTTVYKFSVK